MSSLVGTLSVIQLLVALLIARRGDDALAALAESDAQLTAFAADWDERCGDRRRPADGGATP